jgi:hypothetical protein
LNLARPGGTAAQNYYGLVRPELQFRQSVQYLQGAVTANQQAIGGLQADATGLPMTGHQIRFLDLGDYFLNNGASARPRAGVPPPGPRVGGPVGGRRR